MKEADHTSETVKLTEHQTAGVVCRSREAMWKSWVLLREQRVTAMKAEKGAQNSARGAQKNGRIGSLLLIGIGMVPFYVL